MKPCKAKMKASLVLLSSILVLSCNDSADTQSQNGTNNDSAGIVASKSVVAFTTEKVNANVGDVFTLDIAMKDFPVSEGGGVSVRFDANMLNVNNVTINTEAWDFVNKIGSIDNSAGLISNILFSSFEGASGNKQIASITFSAIGGGTSQIVLEESVINPFSSNGKVIAANFVYTDVQIETVQ